MRKASALILALWTIAVLSIMALAFAVEAHMQAGVNLYVRERSRVNRMTDAGMVLAELILTSYSEVTDWSEDEDIADLLEDDRWIREKRALKSDSKCTIGPILLDERDEGSGTVKIDISVTTGGDKINLNDLYSGGDSDYEKRWKAIFLSHGIYEDIEVKDEDGRTINLVNWLIACWSDWRDDDDSEGTVGGVKGAEKSWYLENAEDEDVEDEDKHVPRNGPVPAAEELEYVRGFRDYPAVLTGGLLMPEEESSEDNPNVTGIIGLFGTTGSTKVNVNTASKEMLLTVPGIIEGDDEEDLEDANELVDEIIAVRKIKPDRADVDENRSEWPYKDFADLQNRLEDEYSETLNTEIGNYLTFGPSETDIFEVKITGESMGMTREITARCYVKDKEVRYLEWRED